MTDRQKWKDFLENQGIDFEEQDDIIVITQDKKKVGGYAGFFVEIDFDKEGNLNKFCIWE